MQKICQSYEKNSKKFLPRKYFKKYILKLIKYMEKAECMWYYHKQWVFQVHLDSSILILGTSNLAPRLGKPVKKFFL